MQQFIFIIIIEKEFVSKKSNFFSILRTVGSSSVDIKYQEENVEVIHFILLPVSVTVIIMVKNYKHNIISETQLERTTNTKLISIDDEKKFFNCRYTDLCSKLEISGSNGRALFNWDSKTKWLYNSNNNDIATAKSKKFTLHTETYVFNSEGNVIAVCRTRNIFSLTHTLLIWILPEPTRICDIEMKILVKKQYDIKVKGDFSLKRCIWFDNNRNAIVKINRKKQTGKDFVCLMADNINSQLIFSIFIGLQKMLLDARVFISATPSFVAPVISSPSY